MKTDRGVCLKEAPANGKGRYVLYWMQQSQRVHFKPALEHAIARANQLALPVVTVFGLHAGYPEANERHFAFMPCWCALAAFNAPLAVDSDGAFVNGSVLEWIPRDSSKPGRPAGERWVIHAGAQWSAGQLAAPSEEIARALLRHFFDALGLPRAIPRSWRGTAGPLPGLPRKGKRIASGAPSTP